MTTAIRQRKMPSRGVLARELRALEEGETLIVPFKYCSARNIKVQVAALRKEGLDFSYDNSGSEHSVVTRTK